MLLSASFSSFAIQPLSCEMLTLLVGLTAMERDKGTPRNTTVVAKNRDDELTKKEVKFILDTVYIVGKNQTPDQIKNQIYYSCRETHR